VTFLKNPTSLSTMQHIPQCVTCDRTYRGPPCHAPHGISASLLRMISTWSTELNELSSTYQNQVQGCKMQYDVPLDKVYQMLRQHQQAYDLILQRWRAQIPLDQVEVFEQWVRHCWFDDCQEGLQQRQCIPPPLNQGMSLLQDILRFGIRLILTSYLATLGNIKYNRRSIFRCITVRHI
jgi:hypothetical protein